MMIIGSKMETHGQIGSRCLNMGINAESEVERYSMLKLMCDTDVVSVWLIPTNLKAVRHSWGSLTFTADSLWGSLT